MSAHPKHEPLPLLSLDTSDVKFPNIQVNLRPFLEISEQVGRIAEAWQKSFEPFRESFRKWAEDEEKCKNLVDAGWVPHWSSPFETAAETREDLDTLVTQYYQIGWSDLKDRLKRFHEEYFVDEQTSDVFEQALFAHGAGLYRVNARLIFPEIERLARVYLHRNDLSRTITSQRDFIDLVGHSSPSRLKAHGRQGYRIYRILEKHAYAKVDTKEKLDEISKSEIPNRHAALHGLLPYGSAKSSLNSIFLFDFVAGVTSVFKSLDTNP